MTKQNGSTSHQQINWRSRIVKTGKIAASQIIPHPNNPRKHPELQRQAVAASFDELGQISPIVININNGWLVDGEERSWLALAQEGDVELDVVYVDLSEAEHLKALTYFDATGDLVTYDSARLDALLKEVSSDSPAIQQMLSELAAANGLYESVSNNDPPETNVVGGMMYKIIISCTDEHHQTELLERFDSEGLECQALIS